MKTVRYLCLPGLMLLIVQISTLSFPSQVESHSEFERQSNGSNVQQAAVTPTVDRLAIPILSENPSQFELGNSVYYHHCMPCHGDQGQGLTDEWREVWEEDHQDCWAKGCHSFRDQDEVFTIPTTIPPVTGSVHLLQRFVEPSDLYAYLRTTHPPQNPGILTDEEYWALTDFLLIKNGQLSEKVEVGPFAEEKTRLLAFEVGAGIALGIVLSVLLVSGQRKRSKTKNTKI
jgi:hypothetical protein